MGWINIKVKLENFMIPLPPTHFSPNSSLGFRLNPILLLEALSSDTAAARAEKIQDGIRLLEKQLRSEVRSRHNDFLSQLSSVKDANSSLSSIRSAVSTLQSSVCRVRSEIADPNRHIQSKTVQLSNLHFTIDLLQSTVRVLCLSKKLRDVMAEPEAEKLDLSKAAQLHSEILRLCNENDLSGIVPIDEELKWIFAAGQRLRIVDYKVTADCFMPENVNWLGDFFTRNDSFSYGVLFPQEHESDSLDSHLEPDDSTEFFLQCSLFS
ncbi:hypothetical protein L2E82_31276 [Cichorium intybus]|uniref:Uncharacterized protein n=1 Tax=Cichorium intybus TaxID=13427 RepID=A0ACB9D3E3_CICIN|nr:hypothetical protein L2E82_31276 [Cichorium intybus]